MFKFHISGLEPTAQQLMSTSNYALLAPLDSFVIELALQAISDETAENIFIVSSQIEAFFESPFSDKLNGAYQDQRVYPFSFTALASGWTLQHSLQRAIDELTVYPQSRNSLVMLHLNTEQLQGIDEVKLSNTLNYVQTFLTQSNATLLLLISGPEIANYRFMIRRLNKQFDGSVFIESDAAMRIFDFDFWRHSAGIVTNKQYQLTIKNNQLIAQASLAETQSTFTHSEKNDDEDDVWLVANAVPEGTKLPSSYHLVKDNQQLFNKGPNVTAATLVFSVSRYTDLAELANQCFQLRKNCGRWLKLVIQNVDGTIRHQDECLFLNLGVNLILYSFSEPSRLLSQIQSIQGFQYTRPLPPSAADVLKYTENTFAKGYLPFLEFTRQVEVHSDSAVNLGVSGVLVIFELLPRIKPIHGLHLFHIKRAGDIFSIVDNEIYLYLHACREHDVGNAIQHTFKLKTGDFFGHENLITDHFYIQQKCKELRRRYKGQSIIDYTKQLTENNRREFAAAQRVDSNRADNQSTAARLAFKERKNATPYVMTLKECQDES
ncbi:cellulose biosynthesis protein BcsE [Pseudoalteromonas sp.]|uniref:cellulose biosynthesis protein BcsE n=1 Tax=Pseudoalteromonas sp. TaxID=53249 RepID=UPI003562F52D